MSDKQVLSIVNPTSQPGRVDRTIEIVEKVLREEGYGVEIRVTEKAGDPAVIAAGAAGAVDAILVAGGDGTVCEVINALPDRSTPVGYVPLGTTNVFAREMGIPFDPGAAARAFAGGRPVDLDLGLLGSTRFLLMASYGLDAVAVRRVPLALKRRVGRLAYLFAFLAAVPVFRAEPIVVSFEAGKEPVEATFALFANASRYAGSYVAAPGADMRDGLLDAVCWPGRGRAGAILGVLKLFSGKLSNHPRSVVVRAPSFRFETERPEYFQIDGDPAEGREGRIGVEAKAFKLIAPR